jgi:hypothetical protein
MNLSFERKERNLKGGYPPTIRANSYPPNVEMHHAQSLFIPGHPPLKPDTRLGSIRL